MTVHPTTEVRTGTVAAAWSHRSFRWIYCGSMASNIGTWMQNFALGALADQLTRASWFVGLVVFAQLGPSLLLSPWAGVLADTVDRRKIMIGAAAVQATLSAALAVAVIGGAPNHVLLVVIVAGIGIAGALNAPAANATLPALVGRADLPGAISMNSAQMNLSRVVGPLIAGLIVGLDHPAVIFGINSATYLFVIAAVAIVRFDSMPTSASHESAMQRFIEGLRAARADQVIRRVLITVSLFSFCSLIFIYQMAPFARRNLGGHHNAFTLVFSSFGLGAALSAIAVGTVLIGISRPRLVRVGLTVFAASLGALALQHRMIPAMFAAFATGAAYFTVITALSTILQQQVADEVRGRVMGLWMMGWAGLVPLGSLVGGPIIDMVGLTPVFLFGAAVAIVLAAYARLTPPAAVR